MLHRSGLNACALFSAPNTEEDSRVAMRLSTGHLSSRLPLSLVPARNEVHCSMSARRRSNRSVRRYSLAINWTD